MYFFSHKIKYVITIIFLILGYQVISQNLITNAGISSNANWGGQESNPEPAYFSSSPCANNVCLEADNASKPQQTITGFSSGAQYVISFRYAWRTQTCSSSIDPAILKVQFIDDTTTFTQYISVPSSFSTWTPYSATFTNSSLTSHTIKFTTPGNTHTCGVLIDDISITLLASPGGVGTSNLSTWFRAGTINITDGSRVYGWLSIGNNTIITKPLCSSGPIYKTGLASTSNSLVSNYNPYIVFDGSSNYLANYLNKYNSANFSIGASVFAVYQGGSSSKTFFNQKNSSSTSIFDARY